MAILKKYGEDRRTEGQWIVMMGFLVSIGIIFLAIIINQSATVGQTTAQSVLEFPKSDVEDIQHLIHEDARNNYICTYSGCSITNRGMTSQVAAYIPILAPARKSAEVYYTPTVNAFLNLQCSLSNPHLGLSFMVINLTYSNGVESMYDWECFTPYGWTGS